MYQRSKAYARIVSGWVCCLLCCLQLGLATARPNTDVPPQSTSTESSRDLGVGGFAGNWGGHPLLGLRGIVSLGLRLQLRINWSLKFDLQEDNTYTFSAFSFGLLVRLPTPHRAFRFFGVTRVDLWPLLRLFEQNAPVQQISDLPVLGVSILLGIEFFVLPKVSYFLETGFSSGMVLGFGEVRKSYRAFGFVAQSGLQLYF